MKLTLPAGASVYLPQIPHRQKPDLQTDAHHQASEFCPYNSPEVCHSVEDFIEGRHARFARLPHRVFLSILKESQEKATWAV